MCVCVRVEVSVYHAIRTWTADNVKSKEYPSGCNKHAEAKQKAGEQPDACTWIHTVHDAGRIITMLSGHATVHNQLKFH